MTLRVLFISENVNTLFLSIMLGRFWFFVSGKYPNFMEQELNLTKSFSELILGETDKGIVMVCLETREIKKKYKQP